MGHLHLLSLQSSCNIVLVQQVEQLHKIFKLCGSPSEEYWKKSKLPHATIFKPQQPYKRCIAETFKDFPPSSLPLIETLLAIDPAERQTATAALRSEVSCFFETIVIFLCLFRGPVLCISSICMLGDYLLISINFCFLSWTIPFMHNQRNIFSVLAYVCSFIKVQQC